MIIVATRHEDLVTQLKESLTQRSMQVELVDVNDRCFLQNFYNLEVTAIIADERFPGFPLEASIDIFNSLGGGYLCWFFVIPRYV